VARRELFQGLKNKKLFPEKALMEAISKRVHQVGDAGGFLANALRHVPHPVAQQLAAVARGAHAAEAGFDALRRAIDRDWETVPS
jgi:hypothetical protein